MSANSVTTTVTLGNRTFHLDREKAEQAIAAKSVINGRDTMKDGITLEKQFIRDCLPVSALGLNSTDFETYIDYIADRRLASCGLAPLNPSATNPFPWLAEMMDIKKEQNFFEGRVTEYQKASSLNVAADDEL